MLLKTYFTEDKYSVSDDKIKGDKLHNVRKFITFDSIAREKSSRLFESFLQVYCDFPNPFLDLSTFFRHVPPATIDELAISDATIRNREGNVGSNKGIDGMALSNALRTRILSFFLLVYWVGLSLDMN